ncbi:unnamed protein product, partial [Rotaria sp. Silwood2]
ANDYIIVRSFSILLLIREKKLFGQFRLDNSNIYLHNVNKSLFRSYYNPVIDKQKDGILKKYGRHVRNVMCKKVLIPPEDLTVHQNISLKSNETNSTSGIKTLTSSIRHPKNILIRTPESVRRSLTLANTRSSKSLNIT